MGISLVSLRSSILLCMVWLTLAAEMDIDPVLENIFKARSDDDWRAVWHTEKHRKCYHELLIHMDWVCRKDVYAVKRKKRTTEPFVDAEQAHRFLGGRRRKRSGPHHALVKRGIIDECCHGSEGCSWEEYAEYCPANSRLRT